MINDFIITTEKLQREFAVLEGNIQKVKQRVNKQEDTLNQLQVLSGAITKLSKEMEVFRSNIQVEEQELKEDIELAWSKLTPTMFYTRRIIHKENTRLYEILGEEELYYDYLNFEDEKPLWCMELCSIQVDVKVVADDIEKSQHKELVFLEGCGLVLIDTEKYQYDKKTTYSRNKWAKVRIDDVLGFFSKKGIGLGLLTKIEEVSRTLNEKVTEQLKNLVQLIYGINYEDGKREMFNPEIHIIHGDFLEEYLKGNYLKELNVAFMLDDDCMGIVDFEIQETADSSRSCISL